MFAISVKVSTMRKRSFTLIELLIVLVIVGVLVTVAIPQYEKMRERSIISQAYKMIGVVKRAEDAYYMETGKYTHSWGDLGIKWPEPSDKNLIYNLVMVGMGEGWYIHVADKANKFWLEYWSEDGEIVEHHEPYVP